MTCESVLGEFSMAMGGRLCRPVLLLAGVVAIGLPVRASDWPQWQGPERDTVCRETGLLQSWPPEGPPLAWKAKDLGGGYSAPSIAAGRIFGMSFRGQDEVVWALDENGGKELWSTRIATAGHVGYGEGPRCTPTVDGDRVYALGVSGDLACLEVATGRERWHKNFHKDFGGQMMSGWGYSESPLVDGDRLVCTPGGKDATMVALNKNSGDVLWKSRVPEDQLGSNGRNGAGYASPVVTEVDGLRQYVTLMGRGIIGVAAADGKFLWGYNKIANGTANIPTPIVHGNFVFCSAGYGSGSALVRLTREADGIKATEVYYLPGKILQNHHGGLVLVGEYLYGGHGHNSGAPTCIKFATGEVLWRQDHGPGSESAAVLYADGRLYFRYQDGIMALVEATPAQYHLLSKFKLPENSGKPSWPHPVIANGKLYIRDQNMLLCFDVKHHP